MSLPTINENLILTNWVGFQVYAFARDLAVPIELYESIEEKLRAHSSTPTIEPSTEGTSEAEPKSILK